MGIAERVKKGDPVKKKLDTLVKKRTEKRDKYLGSVYYSFTGHEVNGRFFSLDGKTEVPSLVYKRTLPFMLLPQQEKDEVLREYHSIKRKFNRIKYIIKDLDGNISKVVHEDLFMEINNLLQMENEELA